MADGHWITCWKCKVEYFLPMPLYVSAKAREDISFFCPYGHSAHYPKGQTEEEKLRLERDRLTQHLAQKDDEIKYQREIRMETERKLTAQRGLVTRIKNRVGHGVCPCCSRTFENLQRHMKSKHADYAKGEAANSATIN